MSVSYFNAYPWVATAEEFQALALASDRFGAPRGIERHLEFARSVGLPFAVSEWGNNGEFGDSPTYVRQMYGFFNANAGVGPGHLAYEVAFNVDLNDHQFSMTPQTRAPQSAQAYRDLW